MTTNNTLERTNGIAGIGIEMVKDPSGKPETIPPVQPRAKAPKLSALIDLTANDVESKYKKAFEAVMKAGVDRMPASRAKVFVNGIKGRLVVDSQPNRRQANIIQVGKPDIEHAHTLHLWVGHEDYATAMSKTVDNAKASKGASNYWTTVAAHIVATGLELLYKANTMKARHEKEGNKLTKDFKSDLALLGVSPESRVGAYRGGKGLDKWVEGKTISQHLQALSEMYVPVYTPKADASTAKTTVTLVCVPGCKLTDAAPYGIKVKKENVNDYISLLRCEHHASLTIKDED
jgi:hypothetical protein